MSIIIVVSFFAFVDGTNIRTFVCLCGWVYRKEGKERDILDSEQNNTI